MHESICLLWLKLLASLYAIVCCYILFRRCNVGDTVLLCLDERHDHYVVFTVGTTLHFLHSDCLDALSLRTGPGEARRSWVLAEILDKEYCQAKKPQNRFKVPVGAKFYRVRARPWSRDSSTSSTYRDQFLAVHGAPASLSDVARSPPLHQDSTIQRAYDEGSSPSSPMKRDKDSR
ncbi:hypothetical protein CAPTEDRAFT_180141 [Capitella teleta]|uniref:Autophagy-related protein 11 C-terminal domain-containing protein n=1 Tax=Capitella teleta TaxID=283909 RepID=N1PB67_CAPTE|nr:hypothetical protein CAPTEDRAFT_180141 [Capitella teleta]|eukprot:ELU18826.1 hypothetical protein CAPTEDRAFT_180141 [Capitella teleta]